MTKDNIVPLENATLINPNKRENKRTQSRLITLIEVLFLKGTMLSVLDISESVNECAHTDQQKIKFYILVVRRKGNAGELIRQLATVHKYLCKEW